MVTDVNTVADKRMGDLNLTYLPTTYFDGGYSGVVLGGETDTALYTAHIRTCGNRAVAPLGVITAIDHLSSWDYRVRVRVTNGIPANVTPDLPGAPVCEGGLPNQDVEVQAITADADSDQVYYQFDWGDGTKVSTWYGPYTQGETITVTHKWASNGEYSLLVKAKDAWNYQTGWSQATIVTIGCCELRGDIVASGQINIEDLLYLVDYMFNQGPPPACMDAADINGNGVGPDIEDLLYMVDYMFNSGPVPVPCQ